MLRGIRTASANWLGRIVLILVMGLLVVSFAIWGIGDIFRGFGTSTVATVGGTDIGVEQFRQTYNDRLQQLSRQIGRPITPDQARALGFDRRILGEVIAEAAFDERARQLGLAVPDASVARSITEDTNFQGPTGRFDRFRFEQLIRSAGYTEARYTAEQRRVMLRRQIADAVSGDVTVPQTAADLVNRYQNEQRTIDYATLDSGQAGDIPQPTAEELAKFFEDRKTSFRAPEYREATLLMLTPAEVARWMEISDADAKQAYEERRAQYVQPEQRRVQQIVLPNAEEARAAAEKLTNGLSFAQLAAERGLAEKDLDLGLVTKAGMIDRAVADAAFALPEGGTSAPVQGRFGTVIVHVTKIEPERVRTFEDVAQEIRQTLALERARHEVQDYHDKIEDERAGGQTLAEASQKLGLTSRSIETDRSGRGPDGAVIPDLPPAPDLLGNIFASDVGVETDPVQMQNAGYVWYEVTNVKPSRDRSLEEVKDRVEARWREAQIAERLQAKASALVDKLKAGASLAEIATAEGLTVKTESALKRGRATADIPEQALAAVFRTPQGAPGSAEGDSPSERIVFQVKEITVPKLDLESPEGKRIAEALQRSVSDDLLNQYLAQVQNDLGVSINQTALRQVVGGEIN
jgi:peptidyl-prolyl cis-trans isomerase D